MILSIVNFVCGGRNIVRRSAIKLFTTSSYIMEVIMDVGIFSFDSHSTDWDYGILVCCAIRPLGICSCSGR